MNSSKQRFDALAGNYDQQHAVLRANAVAAAIRRQAGIGPDMDVLDFGAGTGLVTLALQPYVRSVTAVDTSQGMLDILRTKTQEGHIDNVSVLHCDLGKGCPAELEVDLVVSVMTMHHVADVAGTLRMLHSVLRPGGRIAVSDLDTEDGSFHPDKTGVEHHGFDREFMARLLRDAGFGKIEVSTAHKMSKEVETGEVREFSIFLITGEIV